MIEMMQNIGFEIWETSFLFCGFLLLSSIPAFFVFIFLRLKGSLEKYHLRGATLINILLLGNIFAFSEFSSSKGELNQEPMTLGELNASFNQAVPDLMVGASILVVFLMVVLLMLKWFSKNQPVSN